jgi:hypothetical protein
MRATALLAAAAGLPELRAAESKPREGARLFPTALPNKQWLSFAAAGVSKPACGVIYRLQDRVTNGMALGGVDTGCVDLETSGLLGYRTLFNTHVPRGGPVNLPLLGVSAGGRTWVLCDPKQVKAGSGDYQPPDPTGSYRIWNGQKYVKTKEAFQDAPARLKLEGLGTAKEIHYWGHYPVVDLEFETDAPISVGLRAWAPFLPGCVVDSMLPGLVFEVRLRNVTRQPQPGTIALSFPGPTAGEAGGANFARQAAQAGPFKGMTIIGALASYGLGIVGKGHARFGGELGGDGSSGRRSARLCRNRHRASQGVPWRWTSPCAPARAAWCASCWPGTRRPGTPVATIGQAPTTLSPTCMPGIIRVSWPRPKSSPAATLPS